ncbi:HAMP domain-containing histidine kinase [Brevundimonas intermedia]|uniref:histidine kinase n=1 Tax=Brevundimonas intermedia TaxID=74315 RepID=A0A4Y9RTI0_9CAUL|nr:sensor histidine kinase [Brevundimonas intermedia]TFW12212.1 HAMP domain-containing histidine kinase [Brevundimonas intermedia]
MTEASASRRQDWGRWFGRPGRSLTRRLIWLASAWILVALVVAALVLTQAFQESALRRLGAMLNETIDEIVVGASRTPQGDVVAQIQDARTLRLLSGKYWQIMEVRPDGRLVSLARSTSLWSYDLTLPPDLPDRLDAAFGDVITFNTTGPKDDDETREPLRVAASMKSIPRHEHPVIFIAAIDRSEVDADTRQFARVTWTALLILGLGLVSAVFIQVRIGLRPLFDLRDEIADVRKGKSARIGRSYPLEIQPLAEQVNRLLDHNQEVVERQRTHVGNLAHALKTPISVMLAEAGTTQGSLPELVRRQTKVMQGQVDHHLRRARAAARAAHGLGETTPVAEVLDELAVMIEQVFRAKDVEIDWRAPDSLSFLGERQDLQEILGNLIENAAKFSKRRVRVSAGGSGLGQMILVVEDDGPGLPADQRDTVMQRGARLDESAPGSGLGLSIVDDLTRAYGGRLNLADSDMGGLKAVLELPAAQAD